MKALIVLAALFVGCADNIYNTNGAQYTKQIKAPYTNQVNGYEFSIDSVKLPDMAEYAIIGSIRVSDTTSDTVQANDGYNISSTSYDFSAMIIKERYSQGLYVITIDKRLPTAKGNMSCMVAKK